MSKQPPPARKHVKLSNRSFKALAGNKWICLDCGQTDRNHDKVCPGPAKPEVSR